MRSSDKKGRLTTALLLAAAALALTAAAALLFTVRVGGRLYLAADIVDARGREISCEDYEEAHSRRPDIPIRWDVPLGEDRFDSFSESIAISSMSREETDRFGLFPNLKTVDATGCGKADLPALAEAARRFGDIVFLWSVPSSDGPIDGNTETLEVRQIGPAELEELLPLLPKLGTVDLRASGFDEAQTDAFAAAHDDLEVLFSVPLWGMEIPGNTRELRLRPGVSGDIGELAAAIGRLTKLEKLDLRDSDLAPSAIASILPLCEGIETQYVIRLFGKTYVAELEELDLSGTYVGDLAEVEAAADLMPALKRVVMCDCGVPDEEMDALDQRHENIRFIWTVYFSVYALRTDATVFCASNVPWLNFLAPELNDAQIYPIRYCRDLIALDLGHMVFTDLSFLYNMPHLQYLIIVEGRFHDITPIGSLEELEYLEIFMNRFSDISPLLNCKKLEHLNMCYCTGFDISPLAEMKQLKRLWYAGLGPGRGAAIAEALPDTVCYFPYTDPQGSTGGGWREDEEYYVMRDVFGMYYQPGGTGIH